jgi:hypothetical protein
MVARLLGLEIDLSAFCQLAEGDPFCTRWPRGFAD